MAMHIPPQLPRIRCAICDKPVDRVFEEHDHINDVWRLKVQCHGDTDEMRVQLFKFTPEQLAQMKDQEGVAFSVKRISADGGAA